MDELVVGGVYEVTYDAVGKQLLLYTVLVLRIDSQAGQYTAAVLSSSIGQPVGSLSSFYYVPTNTKRIG